MAIEPVKGDLIKGSDSGANNRQYDDILGKFRESLIKKAKDVVQYHKDNVKRKNKDFVGVGVYDKVNSPANEGTWQFSGATNDENKFEGQRYDIWYKTPDMAERRRIRVNDVFLGKDVNIPNDGQVLLNGTWNWPGGISSDPDGNGATLNGQQTQLGHRRILGTTDSRDYVHQNNNPGPGDDTFGGVKEGEFGQSRKYSVAWNLARITKLICGVRKAQFKERMAKTDRSYAKNPPFTVGQQTVTQKSLKNIEGWYTYTKLDGFNGWTHFDPVYFSSTDNYAWELMKKVTSNNYLRGQYGDYANFPGNNFNNRSTWINNEARMGPNKDPYGAVISAANLRIIFDRLEDEWKDMANADGRKIFVTMDYCHTSCHASCHSSVGGPGGTLGNPGRT